MGNRIFLNLIRPLVTLTLTMLLASVTAAQINSQPLQAQLTSDGLDALAEVVVGTDHPVPFGTETGSHGIVVRSVVYLNNPAKARVVFDARGDIGEETISLISYKHDPDNPGHYFEAKMKCVPELNEGMTISTGDFFVRFEAGDGSRSLKARVACEIESNRVENFTLIYWAESGGAHNRIAAVDCPLWNYLSPTNYYPSGWPILDVWFLKPEAPFGYFSYGDWSSGIKSVSNWLEVAELASTWVIDPFTWTIETKSLTKTAGEVKRNMIDNPPFNVKFNLTPNVPHTPQILDGPMAGYENQTLNFTALSLPKGDGQRLKYELCFHGEGVMSYTYRYRSPDHSDVETPYLNANETANLPWSVRTLDKELDSVSYSNGFAQPHQFWVNARAVDANGNRSAWSEPVKVLIWPDVQKPIVSNVKVTNITATGAEIRWDTNENATSLVKYDNEPITDNSLIASNDEPVTSHVIKLSGLAGHSTYHFTVYSSDFRGNMGRDFDEHTFTTLNRSPRTPVIPDGPIIGFVGQELFFSTYAIDPDGDRVSLMLDFQGDNIPDFQSPLVASGSDVRAPWTYRQNGIYQVKAMALDPYHGISEWSQPLIVQIFGETTPPVISNVTITNVTARGATIQWQTDEPANSQVEFGTDGNFYLTPINPALTLTHTVALVDLLAKKPYVIRVLSVDTWNNKSRLGDFTFFTDTAPVVAPPNGPLITTNRKITGYSASATDPDGDNVYLTFYWGDNTSTRVPTAGSVSSGTTVRATHLWKKGGTYNVTVVATDINGVKSSYSTPLKVKVYGYQ